MSEALEDTAILPSSFLKERAKPVPEALEGTILQFLWFFQPKVDLFFKHSLLGYTGKNAKANLLNSAPSDRRT